MDRPYRKGLAGPELHALLTSMKGRNLDPDLVELLFSLINL